MPGSEFKCDLKKLPPELEEKFPNEIKVFREFWFSLSEEERQKHLTKVLPKVDKKLKEEDLPEGTPEWVTILHRLAREAKENPQPKEKSKNTKYCFECGHMIIRTAKFCEECGTKQPIIRND